MGGVVIGETRSKRLRKVILIYYIKESKSMIGITGNMLVSPKLEDEEKETDGKETDETDEQESVTVKPKKIRPKRKRTIAEREQLFAVPNV
ncbi:hypothetical protein MXB_2006 [Myxobolus squamalis]|nr:hypothetical protein MXB_2006 [Myxobolus squamalis]